MSSQSRGVRREHAHRGQLLRVVVDVPKGNVYSAAVLEEIEDALREAAKNPSLKLVTLEGAGKHFSYGASIEEHRAENIGQVLPLLRRAILAIARSEVPVAALVQGACLGGAFEAVLACHFTFATPTAFFGLPEIKLGVFPPAGAALLPGKLGQSAADRLVLSGENLSSDELQRLGMIHRIFPESELFSSVEAWLAVTLGTYSASSLRHATRASRRNFLEGLEERIQELEQRYLADLMTTHDANEGISAFLAKRQAVWRNA